MGTSISKRSPQTNSWRAVAATYLSESFPIDRVIREIWRAAQLQPSGDLTSDLSNPIISRCFNIVLESNSPQDAYKKAARAIALSGPSNLATDMAKRAVVSSFLRHEERTSSFVKILFAEAIDYLASRDLPSYIGTGNRLRNVSDSITFKKNIRAQVENIVGNFRVTRELQNEDNWKKYVKQVIISLAGNESYA